MKGDRYGFGTVTRVMLFFINIIGGTMMMITTMVTAMTAIYLF
jgi:hypothetical protein